MVVLTLLLLLAACDAVEDPGEEPVEITLLVALTEEAANRIGEPERLVGRAVSETNAAYRNSGLRIRLRAVRLAVVEYAMTERLQDLERLVAKDDGHLDELHAWRDGHEADIVVLVPDKRDATINAAVMADESTAFIIVHWEHLGSPSYALAHEIGHLQGARHTPENDPLEEPFPYGHGFRSDPLMTIMATGLSERIPYFSGPDQRYEGVTLGDSAERHVARVLRETAVYVSNFRGPRRPTDFVPPDTWPVVDPAGRVRARSEDRVELCY